jgi:aldehyde:ferredoxin oxidoreductase
LTRADGVIRIPSLSEGLKEYYAVRGLDLDTGRPTRTKLLELGLDDVVD